MSISDLNIDKALEPALHSGAAALECEGWGRWRRRGLAKGSREWLSTVSNDGRNLRLSAPANGEFLGELWDVALAQGRSASLVRMGLTPHHEPVVLADVSLVGPEPYETVRRVLRDADALDHETACGPAAEPAPPQLDVKRICEALSERGWKPQVVEEGHVSIPLEVGLQRAKLTPAGDARWKLGVRELELETPERAQRNAVASVLLQASERIRSIRGAVLNGADRYAAGFEVMFSSSPTVGELDDALHALGAVCSRTGRELRLLVKRPTRYLQLQQKEN